MNIKRSVKEYLGLKSDAFKLGLVENFSLVINQFLGTLLLILVLLTALVFIATGTNKWLGMVLDNAVAASFITGGFFLLLFFILFLLRKKLFINSFVRLFAKMFFEEKDPNVREN
ncbi:MAG TPA: hypothetical protein PKU85_01265 [Bacteroidales bacterium]|nr:MAG: hypothetical protein BWX62_01236 [Bacteroidetes bacterium ADurb.Bin037]HPV87829.1 hypothetical protein [Bacteroidales bacterium]HPW78861.1 hypothetical protein [Bacteroidales bacterium]HQB55561.1 hypothetical protein [Bacteroidales bacterium]